MKKDFRISDISRYFFLMFYLICLVLYIFTCTSLHKNSEIFRADARYSFSSWDISPPALEIIAGEFKGIVSDFLVLEVGAYLGADVIQKDKNRWIKAEKNIEWQKVIHMFSLIQTMDPHFIQPLYMSQGWLPWAGYVDETNNFLLTYGEHNPLDWRPYHLLGFNSYYFEKNYANASEYFLRASKLPDAPTILTALGTRFAARVKNTQSAILLIKSMLLNKTPENPDFSFLNDRLIVLKDILKLEKAMHAFNIIIKTPLDSINELQEYGFIDKLPTSDVFCLDNTKTKVLFGHSDCHM